MTATDFSETSGRDRPVDPSAGPARWRQTWHHLVFLHWPVPVKMLRLNVPTALDIDTHDGNAWLAVTPFWMSGVTLSGFPAVPGLSSFAELNVRTYVRHRDGPGVWFFSLDAGSYLAVLAARALFHLNYVYARMKVELQGDGVSYLSERPDGTTFSASYRPSGEPVRSAPGSLEAFLTERYRLYAWSKGQLYRSEIDHVPWPLQPAEAEVGRNDMPAVNGARVEGKPLAHYARRLDVRIWPLVKVQP